LTKEIWRGCVGYGRVQISGIGYNTRGRVQGTGKRAKKGRAGGIRYNTGGVNLFMIYT